MSTGTGFRSACRTGLPALFVAVVACSKPAADPNNREIPWSYGPATGGASAEHVDGTGKATGKPIAAGWQCRLLDKKRLVVKPYKLAEAHPLFGKAVMAFGLFDKNGQQIETLVSGVVTPQNASFTFEISDAAAAQLWDLVIWYRKP